MFSVSIDDFKKPKDVLFMAQGATSDSEYPAIFKLYLFRSLLDLIIISLILVAVSCIIKGMRQFVLT